MGMAAAVGEFGGAAFDLAEDTFNNIPVTVCSMLESEPMPAECWF